MSYQPHANTRIWWDGREVNFIRWTDGTLVFAWQESDETAMHIPRGAVTRLIDRGVLKVKGDLPQWLDGNLTLTPPALEPTHASAVSARPSALPMRRDTAPLDPSRLHNRPAPADNRRSIVARLLRKLGGDPDRIQTHS